MTNIREIVFDTLLAIDKGEQGNNILSQVLDKYSYLDKQDRSFMTRLTEGTIERQVTIDHVLNLYSKTPVNKMKPPVRALLRMGVYQIIYMDAVPDSAACNESVKIAKKRGLTNLSGFINGVLRTVARNKNNISMPDRQKDVVKYMSVYYSCPEWIVKLLIDEQGLENAEHVLNNSIGTRQITGRVNISKCDVDDLVLKNNGIIEKNNNLPYAISLHNYDKITDIEDFNRGLFAIQDLASMLAVHVSDIKDGDIVIDVCAAPGGKSLHAADRVGDGRVISCDISDEKITRINENVERCGFGNIDVRIADATIYNEEFEKKADVVIADVPCSGLGVMGRKNDIKHRLSSQQMDELPVLQKKIIDTVTNYVKPGGVLIYSTCTVHNAENIDNFKYIAESKDFDPVDFYDCLPDKVRSDTAHEGFLQLYGKDGLTDGFFISKLRRRAE